MCRAVRYRISAAPIAAGLCHCDRCRPQSGSAFSTVIIIRRSTTEIEGETAVFDDIGSSGLHVARRYCPLRVATHDRTRRGAGCDARESRRHRRQRMVSSGHGIVRGPSTALGRPGAWRTAVRRQSASSRVHTMNLFQDLFDRQKRHFDPIGETSA
jgi:hypothetical protein